MITPDSLRSRLPNVDGLKASTLEIWCFALNYIFEHGWADITDSRFVRSGTRDYGISSQSLMRHLRRMADRGLLTAHRLKEESDMFSMILDDHSAPRVFMRYTFPGVHAQLHDTRPDSPRLGRRGHDLTAKEERYWDRQFANTNKPNKPQHDNRLTSSESNFHRD